jgi:hypothetical protein
MISPSARSSFEKDEVLRIAVTGAMPEAVYRANQRQVVVFRQIMLSSLKVAFLFRGERPTRR